MLAFVLVFLRKFDDLSALPVAYTSMIIVIVASGLGKTIGACVQGVFLGLGGVVLEAGLFAILTKLGNFPVAEAIVFAVIVYCEFYILISTSSAKPCNSRSTVQRLCIATYSLVISIRPSMLHLRMPMTSFTSSSTFGNRTLTNFFLVISLIKAIGIRWFGFSLLAIRMAFNDIYTPILLGGIYSPRYLKEYLIGYPWGEAITLCVNILVSSGCKLREALVKS